MSKLYRFEGRCSNFHRWITSPTPESEPQLQKCPTCGVQLDEFMRMELTGRFSFTLESAEFLDRTGRLAQENRVYIAIQDQNGNFIARKCQALTWEEGLEELVRIKSINKDRLLKLISKKGWTVYI